MRALVMTGPADGPELTEVRDVAVPQPAPGEVTIRVSHAGINFIDVMAQRGDPGYTTGWPHRPGNEVSGTVLAVGAGVIGLAEGDRVAAFTAGGGLAEVALARASLTVPLPDAVPFTVAASAPLMLTSALLLLTDAARVTAGERVLVHSASGGVGSAVAKLVPALGGATLIGTVGRASKIAAARGYDQVFARGTEELAGKIGAVDVVLDPQGTALLDLDLAVAAPGARIVLFGNAGGGATGALPPMSTLVRGNVSIAGFSIRSLSVTAPHRVAAGLRRVLDLIASGRLTVPVTEVALDDAAATLQTLAQGRGTGKYVARSYAARSRVSTKAARTTATVTKATATW